MAEDLQSTNPEATDVSHVDHEMDGTTWVSRRRWKAGNLVVQQAGQARSGGPVEFAADPYHHDSGRWCFHAELDGLS